MRRQHRVRAFLPISANNGKRQPPPRFRREFASFISGLASCWDPGQGAMQQMLPPFRLGLGARLGSGRQWMSWVSLRDVVAAIQFAAECPDLAGPLNVTAPNPVTNAEFTRVLGQQLRRPAFLAVPEFALRMMFGQMADEALLASARAYPVKLQAAGFRFSFPEIRVALEKALR